MLKASDQNRDAHPSREEQVRGHSFDELAKGIASKSLSRGQALKLAGSALLGSILAFSPLPRIAAAQEEPACNRCNGTSVRETFICPSSYPGAPPPEVTPCCAESTINDPGSEPSNCLCFSTLESLTSEPTLPGTGRPLPVARIGRACVPRDQPCRTAQRCRSSSSCPEGEVCIRNSCCSSTFLGYDGVCAKKGPCPPLTGPQGPQASSRASTSEPTINSRGT